MDRDITQFIPREGMNVYGSDGDKVGEVDAVEQDYFVVRKGFFFPEDHYIPLDAVSTFDEDSIYLAYTKDEVLSQNWTTAPTTAYDTTTAHDTTTDYDTADRISVPVHEEELVARKRAVDRGAVQVNKEVVSEEHSIDVPVTEERVKVTRRNVSGDVVPDATAFQKGTIEVPVRGEEVDVEKRARVVGEIDIAKTAEQRTERVADTVRREEVTVDDDVVATDEFDDQGRRRV